MQGLVGLLLATLLGSTPAPMPAEAGVPTHATVLRALTAPELAGRGAGTTEERQAARQVATWFEAVGLEPIGGDRWLHDVPLAEGNSVNVLGMIPGTGDLAGHWIIVGAHLDHLGRVNPASTEPCRSGDYYPGAGDNASGVSVLIATAFALGSPGLDRARSVAAPGSQRSILFCAFGAEETGIQGSQYLVENMPAEVASIDAMVNLDAVGRLLDGPLHVAGPATCEEFATLLGDAAGPTEVQYHDPLLLGSDHLSFLATEVPSLFFFTSAYPQMNTTADSLTTVDLDGLRTLTDITARLVSSLRRVETPMTFVAPPPAERPAGGNRQTWFGSAPDFAGTEADGYLLGGVSPGGPADLAGLRQGDLLVTLAGVVVTDLASFTQRLRSFDPLDVVEVEVLRDGRRLDFLVTLGDRSQRSR